MKMLYDKILSKNEINDTMISRWIKPKGYDLSLTALNIEALKIHANLAYGKIKEFSRFLKDKHDYNLDIKQAIAMCVSLKDENITWHYVLIQENEWRPDHYGTICHELHHLTHFSLSEKGVIYGEGGEEVFAYLQGHLMELVVRAFVELKKSKK